MVLVDSVAWIRHLYGVEPFVRIISGLSNDERVLGHDFVYGELLIGDSNGARAKFLSAYTRLRYARTVPHREVVELVRARRLGGRGIGWVDAHLVAAALAAGAQILTGDKSLRDVAAALDILYTP
jgi:predicted nucleic acid-binding protein